MSEGSCSSAVGETLGLAMLGLCFTVSSDVTVPQKGILFATYLSGSLPSVPMIMSETVTRPWAILTQDFESLALMWVLEPSARIGGRTVSTDLWYVLWTAWFWIHATQQANGDFFQESRVVVWKLKMASNQKGSVKYPETGGGILPARRPPEWQAPFLLANLIHFCYALNMLLPFKFKVRGWSSV